MSRPPGTLRQRLFARFMAAGDEDSHAMYAERKQALLSGLRGTVVEIGPGTGVNLPFYTPPLHWIGLEPNPAMHDPLRRRAEEVGLDVELRAAPLDEAGFEDGSVDCVVSTLVLCSVPDLRGVLQGVRRVLKPGGRFVFLEHVVDRPGTLRRLVQKTAPYTPWRYFSDGCDPGRRTGEVIRQAGFAEVEVEEYMQDGAGVVGWVVRPHVVGWAVR